DSNGRALNPEPPRPPSSLLVSWSPPGSGNQTSETDETDKEHDHVDDGDAVAEHNTAEPASEPKQEAEEESEEHTATPPPLPVNLSQAVPVSTEETSTAFAKGDEHNTPPKESQLPADVP